MNSLKRGLCFLVILCLASFLTACEKEGPAEKAGKKIDAAVEETKEEFHQAKENIEDKMESDSSEGVVEETKEELRQAKENVEDTVKE